MGRVILSFLVGVVVLVSAIGGGGFLFYKTGRLILDAADLPYEEKAAYVMVGACAWMVGVMLGVLAWVIGSGIMDTL